MSTNTLPFALVETNVSLFKLAVLSLPELAEFKELKNPLIVQKTLLEQQLAKIERGEASPIEPLKNFILAANQAQKWVVSNNWLEMKSFLQNVGLNRQIRSQTLARCAGLNASRPFARQNGKCLVGNRHPSRRRRATDAPSKIFAHG